MKTVLMRYPEGKAKAVTFSYDDGCVQDQRLAELFHRYGLKATFNLNCERARKFFYTKEEIRAYFLEKGHEIAVHGAIHRANGNLRPIEGIRDVLECRLELEEKCDQIIRGMAYPDSGIRQMGSLGTYEAIKQYLVELDIAYARSLGEDNDSFLIPSDFHNWIPSAHHDNPQMMEYIEKFIQLDISPAAYHARRIPRLLYIWGHSFEFDRNDNWDHIEEICKRLSGREDFWYATNIEIYDYVQAYKSLRYSANGKKVYNPTLIPLWLDVDKTVVCIPSGETVLLEK